jgi:hypothetical protein
MIEWHRGIKEYVCFAALIPAILATAKTSPFSILFLRTSSKAVVPSDTRDAATATLLVVFFALTSIIFAFPALSAWVSIFSAPKKFELLQFQTSLVEEKFDTEGNH